MLIEIQNCNGLPSEYDLFIAQAVLQYLSLRNLSGSHGVFTEYLLHHPTLYKEIQNKAYAERIFWNEYDKEIPIFDSPMINFINLLLISIKR